MTDKFYNEEPYFHLEYQALKNEATARLWQNPTGLLLHLIKSAYRGGEKHFSTRCKAAFADGFICAEYSIPALAREFGASDRSVSTWLDKLIEMGVLAQPDELQLDGKPAVYMVGYWSPYRKQDGSSGKVFAYYLNEPLPPTHAESCMATHAESCMAPHAENCMPTHAENCMQHEISNSTSNKEVTRMKAPPSSQPKKYVPGAGEQPPSGSEPSDGGKPDRRASGRAKADPNGKAKLLDNGGVKKVEFRNTNEDEIIAAFEKKYLEVEGRPYDSDDKDRTKVRYLLARGHKKEEIIAAIGFYISAYKRFTWGNGTPTLTIFAIPKFYARLAARDKTLFAATRQDTPNSGEAASEAEAPIVDKLKEIWS